MHAGSRVVRLSCRQGASEAEREAEAAGEWSFEILARFEEHGSMNYGSDAQPVIDGRDSRRTVVSTSFYDKLLCVWHVDSDGKQH